MPVPAHAPPLASMTGGGAVFRIEALSVAFALAHGRIEAVDRASFEVAAGETLGIVGESGCGKSVTLMAALGLLEANGSITGGRVLLGKEDLLTLPERRLDHIRGREITLISQDPQAALNPVLTIGRQVAEPLVLHEGLGWRAARERAADLLRRVGIPDPVRRLDDYPHELSGGMCQRVMIAIALACRPRLLIADEPTTALDVTIQRQILDLLAELQDEAGMAMVLVTHDLGVIAEMADRVVVMYAGRVVEEAPVRELFRAPAHPYTHGLLRSIARADSEARRLEAIEGTVPALHEMPEGCRFAPRCPRVQTHCRESVPELGRHDGRPGRRVACFHPHRSAAYDA